MSTFVLKRIDMHMWELVFLHQEQNLLFLHNEKLYDRPEWEKCLQKNEKYDEYGKLSAKEADSIYYAEIDWVTLHPAVLKRWCVDTLRWRRSFRVGGGRCKQVVLSSAPTTSRSAVFGMNGKTSEK